MATRGANILDCLLAESQVIPSLALDAGPSLPGHLKLTDNPNSAAQEVKEPDPS
jgi:hypothetical protein